MWNLTCVVARPLTCLLGTILSRLPDAMSGGMTCVQSQFSLIWRLIMTSDALLFDMDREEALSRAYVRAVASYVGYTVSEEDFDRDGIDLRIHAGGWLSPTVGIQLKATRRLGEPSPRR